MPGLRAGLAVSVWRHQVSSALLWCSWHGTASIIYWAPDCTATALAAADNSTCLPLWPFNSSMLPQPYSGHRSTPIPICWRQTQNSHPDKPQKLEYFSFCYSGLGAMRTLAVGIPAPENWLHTNHNMPCPPWAYYQCLSKATLAR